MPMYVSGGRSLGVTLSAAIFLGTAIVWAGLSLGDEALAEAVHADLLFLIFLGLFYGAVVLAVFRSSAPPGRGR